MADLPGIIEATFDLASKLVAVTYDPALVTADAVRQAIETANAQMGHEDTTAATVDLVLGDPPKPQDDDKEPS